MEVLFSVREQRGVDRKGYVAAQGMPVLPMDKADIESLGVFSRTGGQIPASVHAEYVHPDGKVRWVYVSLPVDLKAGEQEEFVLKETASRVASPFEVRELPRSIEISNPYYNAVFTDPGGIRLTTADGLALDGQFDFEIRSDARSAVGGLRPLRYQAESIELLTKTSQFVRVLLKGRHLARKPKSAEVDPHRGYDVELELDFYAFSPVIRFKWRITNYMRFNCSYMWLNRYVFRIPAPFGTFVSGDEVEGGSRCKSWACIETPGGKVAMTQPLAEWLGPGSGVEYADGMLGQGGINPPPDGGFGGKNPDIWRKFFYGMSRTFEGSIVIGGDEGTIESELKPIPIILPAQYYSDCGELPEDGSKVSWGPWKDVVDRAAYWLADNQWRNTLWHGEWWREIDVIQNLGIEEINSGNSPLAPLYHFYRTGDWRFFESAKRSYYYTYDIQFCKGTDGDGPYMHTRRFLLDHQEWFHPRYQRIGGVMRPSHLFGDRREREKMVWLMRWWGEKYIDTDGVPKLPNKDGTWSRCDERAMTIIIESFVLAYLDSGDEFFVDVAHRLGGWLVRTFAEDDWETMAENSNSTRYIQQGLVSLYKLTGRQEYRDLIIRLADWTNKSERFEFGTHYVAFHFNYSSYAYKLSGDKTILEGIYDLAKWVLSRESKEAPGTYPMIQTYTVPDSVWICSYDQTAIVSYLPYLASVMEEAEMKFE